MIHVCFALYDKTGYYSKFTGTTMISIFENTNSAVTVHILHDNTLPQDNRDKFIYIAGQYGQTVKFYNVEELCADRIAKMKQILTNEFQSLFSVAAMYRFLIPFIISTSVEKIIYLDSDIIVNLDINELWKIDLGDNPVAVIVEISNSVNIEKLSLLVKEGHVKSDHYFNSGVLLMNVNTFRKEENNILNAIEFIAKHPQFKYFDQDVLNLLFANRSLRLSNKFNYFVREARFRPGENKIEKNIYHYVAHSLGLDMQDPFNRLWMDYFMKTPFFDTNAVGRLYAGFRQFNVELKQSIIQLSAAMSGKTRTFFVPPGNRDAIKKFFAIHNNEEIISAEDPDSLKKLLKAMKKSHGKKVFFILDLNFPFALLIKEGFVYGKDFFSGFEFLSEAQGISTNAHQLLKLM